MRNLIRALGLMACLMAVPATGTAHAALAANTYTTWVFPGTGYSGLEWHVKPLHDPSPAPYFYANQFGFQDGDGGYFGLQTTAARRPDGTLGKIAIFSIWQSTISSGPPGSSCSMFFHEGTGSSCRIAYDWVAGHDYRLRVSSEGGSTWGAWVKDVTSDGPEVKVGSMTVPTPWGGLRGDVDFTWSEWWGGTIDSCDSLPYSKVHFHGLTANGGAVVPSSHSNSIATGSDMCTNSRVTDEGDGTIQEMGNPPPPPPPPTPPPPPPPLVATTAATAIGPTSATLNGEVNPNGAATGYHFEYGTTSAYGSRIPASDLSLGSTAGTRSVSRTLTSLAPETTYHYRVVARSAGGTVAGADESFRTPGAPAEPGGPPQQSPPASPEHAFQQQPSTPPPQPTPPSLAAHLPQIALPRMTATDIGAVRVVPGRVKRRAWLRFTLSVAVPLRIVVQRIGPGPGRARKTLRHQGTPGVNAAAFTTRTHRGKLPPGRYRATVHLGEGTTGRVAAATFMVVRR